MYCTLQISLNNKQLKKRLIVLAFLFCFIVISMLLEVFINTHTIHPHDNSVGHGGCTTCIQIQGAENLLKQMCTVAASEVSILVGLFVPIAIIWFAFSHRTLLTPITLKIRMNN